MKQYNNNFVKKNINQCPSRSSVAVKKNHTPMIHNSFQFENFLNIRGGYNRGAPETEKNM